MAETRQAKPRVFVDADVLFAGAAAPSEYGASLLVLRMAEITLIEAMCSRQVLTEAERNLREKIPGAVSTFRLLVERSLRVVKDPAPEDMVPYQGSADPEDLPILVAALRERCPWLVTFNTRHYQPGHAQVCVAEPGEFVLRVREILSGLDRPPLEG